MLAAGREPDASLLAAAGVFAGNSHPGHQLSTAVLHPALEFANSNNATGFRRFFYDFGTRSHVWNLYSYVRNNPLTATDPTGNETCSDGTQADVCVTDTQDPVPTFTSFLISAGTQAVQNAVNFTNTALTALNSFRNNPNCAAGLALGGAAAGAGIGAYVGGGAGGAAGFVGGSVVPVAGNAAGLVGGAALGSAGGALAGGSLGGALGGVAGAIFCNGNAGPNTGGSSGSNAKSAKKLSTSRADEAARKGGYAGAEDLKRAFVGPRGSQYDLYIQPNGDVEIFGKGGVGEGIETGINIKN